MFKAHERFKHGNELIVGDARTIVVDGDADRGAVRLRRDGNMGTEAKGVADQIGKRPLQPDKSSLDDEVVGCLDLGIVAG